MCNYIQISCSCVPFSIDMKEYISTFLMKFVPLIFIRKTFLFLICLFLSCTGGLHASIEAYIAANLTSKVSLLATTHREGLIRARMFGARKATGQVSETLDCEVSK